MELEDVSYSDEESSSASDNRDKVRPFTPPSSPEVNHDVRPIAKRETKLKKRKDTKSSRSNGQFVELESDSDDPESRPPAARSGPIQVRPIKTLELDIDPDVNDVEHASSRHRRSKQKKQECKQETKPKKHSPKILKEKPVDTTQENGWPGDLKGIFTIDGTTSDVVLSRTGLTWASVELGLMSSKKKSKKKAKDGANEEFHLMFEDMISVKIKRIRKGKQVEGEGLCQGLAIQTFDEKDNGRLKSKVLLFGNPSQDICMEWSRRIQTVIDGFTGRPKKLLVFLQPYAGKKTSRLVYNSDVLPLFEKAAVTVQYIEVNHNEHIKHEVIHMDTENVDCIVCVGGDGTVTKVISHLLNKTQKDNGIELNANSNPLHAPIPIGIIPTGSFNQICHTVQGLADPVTAAMHILLGHTQPCDICSVFIDDKLYRWAFNSHYGYFGTALGFVPRFAKFGERKVHAAMVKALTKSKYRSYECDIKYIPYTEDTTHNPYNSQQCRQGCTKCSAEKSDCDKPVFDKVESLDPLNESGDSSTLADLTDENPWKLSKGEYSSVSVLSTPALSELSPFGMSRYCHLADGCLDLILVKNVSSKEFTRYLKRHVKQKDQLSLPFVEAIRCTEVHFHARTIDGWNHKDYSVNEILDEERKSKKKHGLHRAESIEVIDDISEDLEDIEDDSELDEKILKHVLDDDTDTERSKERSSSAKKSKQKSKKSKTNGKLEKSVNSDMFCVDDQEMVDKSMGYVNENYQEDVDNDKLFAPRDGQRKHSVDKSAKTASAGKRKAQEKLAHDANMLLHVTADYKPTLIEQETARRVKTHRKQEQKKSEKALAKHKSAWNMDSDLVNELNLHFRIHKGLVRLCGKGIPAKLKADDMKTGCLGMF